MMSVARTVSLYYHTTKYLRWRQIFYRAYYKVYTPKISSSLPLSVNCPYSVWKYSLEKPHQLISENIICIFDVCVDIASNKIWNDEQFDKLWLYNLHYFQDLGVELNENECLWQIKLIDRWIKENPPVLGNGWEAYPLSLRIVNWIKWSISGQSLNEEVLLSLVSQIRYLTKTVEWHLLGNHILSNAKALIFAGLFFEGYEAISWRQQGFKILNEQLEEQILDDGGHFELSPMYHSLLVEDLLDLIQLFQCYKQNIPERWLFYVRKMLGWLSHMIHPDGNFAFFNDTNISNAPKFAALVKYAEMLKITGFSFDEKSKSLNEYAVVRFPNVYLVADVGSVGPDYLPGHAHADTLSFELSLYGERFIVNSGTSTYHDKKLRSYQRSSAAHNTLVLNKTDSSVMWGNFRVAQRARTFDVVFNDEERQVTLTACHDGYRVQKVTHHRTWQCTKKSLIIEDEIIGSGSHYVQIYFHLHPNVNVKTTHDGIWLCHQSGKMVFLKTSLPNNIVETTYYPGFNQTQANLTVVVEAEAKLPLKATAIFEWE